MDIASAAMAHACAADPTFEWTLRLTSADPFFRRSGPSKLCCSVTQPLQRFGHQRYGLRDESSADEPPKPGGGGPGYEGVRGFSGLASRAGLCLRNKESGGKRLSGKTRKGNVYLRRTLCQCAWAATRKKESQLAALYHRIRSRRGHQKAIMAVAHQLIVIIFQLLREGYIRNWGANTMINATSRRQPSAW